jgi:hypothetical protein
MAHPPGSSWSGDRRPGDVWEFIAARIFDLELAATATQAGYDGTFRSGPLAARQ